MTSFVVVDENGMAVLEVFATPRNLKKLKTLKPPFKAVPILEYLENFNRSQTKNQ